MRFIGLDVHMDFCEVAVLEDGAFQSGPKVPTTLKDLEAFAQSLAPDDEVALEATGGAFAVAHILKPYVRRVVVANPTAVRAIAWAKVKTDRVPCSDPGRTAGRRVHPRGVGGGRADPRLFAASPPAELSWCASGPGRRTRSMRCSSAPSRARPLVSDLFGKRGRAWLAEQDLPHDERDGGVVPQAHGLPRRELAAVDRSIAQQVISWPEVRRIMTIPGVGAPTAAAFMATIGDIRRFPTPRHPVGYLGLDPRVRQSGSCPARHGAISKQGSSEARHLLVEAAWAATKTHGPLRLGGWS